MLPGSRSLTRALPFAVPLLAVAGLTAVVVGVDVQHTAVPPARPVTVETPAPPVPATAPPQAPHLAPATSTPPPAPTALSDGPPLAAHEVFGFAPYWTLPAWQSYPLDAVTTVAYFGLEVTGDGSVVESGADWEGFASQDLVDLVSAAHRLGHRVVLSLTCFSQSDLDALASNPEASAQRLATAVAPLLSAKQLDGVNIDFEGRGDSDRLGLASMMTVLSARLRQVDPHWQITMDTYGSSAGDPSGFFDIPALAPTVDAFVVMAYDMGSTATPSPTAPLSGASFSDTDAVAQYLATVPASKVILGIPTYGYQWPTTGPGLGAMATGPPSAVTYAQVLAEGSPTYWDPVTQTPWTAYQIGNQWYQVWFDDPISIARKAQLADASHLAGVADWALGFDGGDPEVASALLGSAPAAQLTLGPLQQEPPASPATRGPTATTASASAKSGSTGATSSSGSSRQHTSEPSTTSTGSSGSSGASGSSGSAGGTPAPGSRSSGSPAPSSGTTPPTQPTGTTTPLSTGALSGLLGHHTGSS